MANPKLVVDVESNAEPLGCVVVELCADAAPKTVNVRVCAHRGKGLTPKGPVFADFMNLLGDGAEPTYGYKFKDKNHRLERTDLESCSR